MPLIVMSFDLSSNCIGVVAADVEEKLKKIMSCPIILTRPIPETFGYLKSKKKIYKKGKPICTSFVKSDEDVSKITKKIAHKRNVEVRNAKNLYILNEIARVMGNLIEHVKPELVLVEKNEIFNGVLTSVLLGKVMGVLIGLCGSRSIPIKEYTVKEVRKKFNIPELISEFSEKNDVSLVPDLTKRVLRNVMEEKYKINFQSDDESDACVILDHWLKER